MRTLVLEFFIEDIDVSEFRDKRVLEVGCGEGSLSMDAKCTISCLKCAIRGGQSVKAVA